MKCLHYESPLSSPPIIAPTPVREPFADVLLLLLQLLRRQTALPLHSPKHPHFCNLFLQLANVLRPVRSPITLDLVFPHLLSLTLSTHTHLHQHSSMLVDFTFSLQNGTQSRHVVQLELLIGAINLHCLLLLLLASVKSFLRSCRQIDEGRNHSSLSPILPFKLINVDFVLSRQRNEDSFDRFDFIFS